ncbi:MAG: calcineurin-like phosphoesterase family protein [Planctomycetota bacterium]|nr:calcineurin-like phosphoesterase family protein [Planctomycetota bacterium]
MRISPILAGAAALIGVWTATHAPEPEFARGVVFEDRDADGARDVGEPGISGVRVSDGARITISDADGKWRLPAAGEAVYFVIKPRNFAVAVAANGTPGFHYAHRPFGSPLLRHPGLAPTGPLPESMDFGLQRIEEPKDLRLLLFGDTQPRNRQEVEWMDRTVVESVIAAEASVAPADRAVFGAVLGDVVFDDLSMFGPLTDSLRRVGIPWWMVTGNHDNNYDAESDDGADETFIRHFGPVNYSFDWGSAHFLVLDDVELYWKEEDGKRKANYRARLDEQAMAYARADLAGVAEDAFVVVLMHIPLTSVSNRSELLGLLSRFPRTLSISGHTHSTFQRDLGADDGWTRGEPHRHIVNVTACGAWWTGQPDERGIPHATMTDGAPKGWAVLTLRDDGSYQYDFRGAELPADDQFSVRVPERAEPGSEIRAHVNVYAGSPETQVEARLLPDHTDADLRTPWQSFTRRVEPDPWLAAKRAAEEVVRMDRWRKMPEPGDVEHLWTGLLQVPELEGEQVMLQVRVRDREGRVWHRSTPILIAATAPANGR